MESADPNLSLGKTNLPWKPAPAAVEPRFGCFSSRHRLASLSPPIFDALRLLLLPVLGFASAWIVLVPMRGDRWWADRLLAWQGGQWRLGHSLLLETVIHRGGKQLSVLAWLAVLGFTAWIWRRPDLYRWRRPAVALLLSVLLSTSIVSLLKSTTQMDCPWDLLGYGGQRPFIDLFATRPAGLPAAACFPAGHASAGYAWVALYFSACAVRPQWRIAGLWTGLAAGLVFGFAQQLRGAHFLSHDLASLMVCWLVALAVYRLVAADGRSTAQGAAA